MLSLARITAAVRYVHVLSPEWTKHNINIAIKFFENVAKFKHLRMTVTNQNCIHGEIINSRVYVGNACYHLVQNIFYSCLLSKTVE
jgi:hypothetical protein